MSWDTPNYAIPGLMPVTSPKSTSSMFDPAGIWILKPYIIGGNWDGIDEIGPVLINGVKPEATLVSARMLFYCAPETAATATLATPEDINIVSSEDWTMSITTVDESHMRLIPGYCSWILETTDSEGVTRITYNGIMEVVEPLD